MTKEYYIRTKSYVDDAIPSTVLDSNDPIYQINQSGIGSCPVTQHTDSNTTDTTISSANDKIQYQQTHNIKPGTPAWFKLWFEQPELTGRRNTFEE